MKIVARVASVTFIISFCAMFWFGYGLHNRTLADICLYSCVTLGFLMLVFSEDKKKIRREEFINNPTTIHTTGVVIATRTQHILYASPPILHFATVRFSDTNEAVQEQETDNSTIPTVVGQKVTVAYAPGQPKTVIITAKTGLDVDIRLRHLRKSRW